MEVWQVLPIRVGGMVVAGEVAERAHTCDVRQDGRSGMRSSVPSRSSCSGGATGGRLSERLWVWAGPALTATWPWANGPRGACGSSLPRCRHTLKEAARGEACGGPARSDHHGAGEAADGRTDTLIKGWL